MKLANHPTGSRYFTRRKQVPKATIDIVFRQAKSFIVRYLDPLDRYVYLFAAYCWISIKKEHEA